MATESRTSGGRELAVDELDESESSWSVEAVYLRWEGRPTALLRVGDSAGTVQIQPPDFAERWGCMSRVTGEIAERDREFDHPILIGGGFQFGAGTLERGAVRNALRLPCRRAVPPIGLVAVQHGADRVNLERIVIRGLLRIGRQEDLDAIVLRYRAVPLGHGGGDVAIVAVETHVQVLVVPEHSDVRSFFLAGLPPVEVERRGQGRGLPSGIVQLAVNCNGRRRSSNLVS